MICHHCGKPIEGEGVPYKVDTYEVRMHKGCRRWYKAKPVTAAAPPEGPEPSVDGDYRGCVG